MKIFPQSSKFNLKLSNQQKGNIGLYYVAYQLTKRGLDVFPTVRNAKGADMYVIGGKDKRRSIPIQIKTVYEIDPQSPPPTKVQLDPLPDQPKKTFPSVSQQNVTKSMCF